MARAWEVSGIGPDTRFRTAAGRVILTRWRELMSHRDAVRAGPDPRALKDMRISSRRLRVAMDAFAPAFPAASFRRRLRVIKEVGDVLGAPRDLDVAIAGLRRRGRALDEAAQPGVDGLVARLAARRAAEEPAVVALLARLEAERFGPRFEEWVRRHTGVDAERLAPGPRDSGARDAGGGHPAGPPAGAERAAHPRREDRRGVGPRARRPRPARGHRAPRHAHLLQAPALSDGGVHPGVSRRPRALIAEVRDLQALLGEIHDRDVQIPALEEHLDWLDRREIEEAGALVATGRQPAPAGDPEAAYAAFRARFLATRRSDERPGLHLLVGTLRGERADLHAAFVARWGRLRAERLRTRLEEALGIRR